MAAQGILYKLPTIDDSGTLKEALQNLKSIPSGKILVRMELILLVTCKFVLKLVCVQIILLFFLLQSVELLWTPQEEDDNLSEQKLRKNYPLLKTFKDYPLVEVVIE